VAIGMPVLFAHTAFAATGDVGQVEDFIRNVIKVVAGLATTNDRIKKQVLITGELHAAVTTLDNSI